MSGSNIAQTSATLPTKYPDTISLFSIFDVNPKCLLSTFKNGFRTCFVVNRWIDIYVHSALLMVISSITVFTFQIVGTLGMLFSAASLFFSQTVITRIRNRVLSVYKDKENLAVVRAVVGKDIHSCLGYVYWDPTNLLHRKEKNCDTHSQELNAGRSLRATSDARMKADHNYMLTIGDIDSERENDYRFSEPGIVGDDDDDQSNRISHAATHDSKRNPQSLAPLPMDFDQNSTLSGVSGPSGSIEVKGVNVTNLIAAAAESDRRSPRRFFLQAFKEDANDLDKT
ncbi:MAG: hypothetical protein AAGI90_02230 [Chlamydiota bacterium]